MTRRILHVVTTIDHFEATGDATGLWLSELTHAYDEFARQQYDQIIISPDGGRVPLEPKSLTRMTADRATRKRHKDPGFMRLLEQTPSAADVADQHFDAIYFAGGHGAMWDFINNADLQALTQRIYEQGGIVASVCHGYCALPHVQLSTGKRLIDGKKLTGFTWREEKMAGVDYQVPYNIEQLTQHYGAKFKKAMLPFASYVVVDDRLVTGQNPASAKKTAQAVIKLLKNQP